MIETLANKRCDRADCPAAAQQMSVVYGQDFYFCNHHAEELVELLAALPAHAPELAEERTAAPRGSSPRQAGRVPESAPEHSNV